MERMFYTNIRSPVKLSRPRRTIQSVVGISYSSPDSSYTQLCAVYTCRCGATVSGVGRQAGFLPRGWLRLSETTCICEHCAERREQAASA